MFTLYRIDFAPARKPLRIGLCLRTVIPARFLSRSEAGLRRSLKWRETNGIRCSYYTEELFVSALKAIQYSMNIALLFVFVVVCLFVCFLAVRV